MYENNINVITIVEDRPEMKYLNRYVRDPLAAASVNGPDRWYDVGLALMGQESKNQLDILKINKRNVYGYCEGMFDLWLQRDTKASWDKLIKTLRKNGLNDLADDLIKRLGDKTGLN